MRAVQVGGPLGAYIPAVAVRYAVDYEALAGIGALLGHGGIVAFDDTVDMARMARYAMEFCAVESCGKCTPCRIGSTRGMEVIDRIIAGRDTERNVRRLEELCETMVQGSLCGLGGMAPFPVQSALQAFQGRLSAHVKSARGLVMFAIDYEDSRDAGPCRGAGAPVHGGDRRQARHGAVGYFRHARRRPGRT